ncbi:formylglycine-generating enzyme family protein [Candidatus Thiodictyon syntrophicum]|nr:formylglycine-generating enzyme family protein [Candidatus Thiodictyon syntrophicum]
MDASSLRSRAAVGRADLLRILAALPPHQWPAAARGLGFSPVPEPPRAPRPAPGAPADPGAGGAPRGGPEPYQPADLPDLPFWCIAADETQAPDPGAADALAPLVQAAPWDALPLSDPACPRPAQPQLVPRPRQGRFLRRHLATARPGTGLDLERLCRDLAALRLPPHLPRRPCPRWPARVDLVLDLTLSLRPYWDDFWQLQDGLRRLLGGRLHLWHSRGGDPRDLVSARDGRPGGPPPGAGALVVLSDAGLYSPGSGRHRRWQDLGRRRPAAPGAGALLIAPVPPRLAAPGLVPGFRLVPWDRGAPLHPLRPGAAPGSAAPSAPDPAAERATAALLAALAAASRVEPALLRALRLGLRDLGTDVGSEYAVWNHPQVRANLLACALAAEHRAAAADDFGRLPDAVRPRIIALRRAYNRHQSPLIQAEEALADGPLAPPADLAAARNLVWRLAATLERGSDAVRGGELAGYVVHLAARRPELLDQNRELAAAWVLARREDLRRGTLHEFPRGLDLDTLGRLLAERGASPPAVLGQLGDALGLFPAGPSQPACPLAEFAAGAADWQVETLIGGQTGSPRVLRLGESLPLDPATRYRLTIGRRRLELASVRRPAWAAGLGRDRAGLFAELADGRRQTLERPGWALRHGIDQAGWWAEFAVGPVVQRMRWVPPGEFLMGSPADEPERFGTGDWAETQHPVVLSQGYWLADTACTQALWEAVLGENPSQFKGAERPVEQVSWDDVTGRFLPALNARVPGLEAVLPTEAQWECACRAGTRTPFSFGSNITTDQVNYDGNYPYAGGAKGEYRNQTVEVKALPANDWGLYQLHGNVWEWCADWVGDYPGEAVVDPPGPPEGRERVLRGGSWINHARYCRSAARRGFEPAYRSVYFGLRLSRGSSPRPAGGGVGVAGVVAGGRAPAAAPAAPAPGVRGVFKSFVDRLLKR